MKHFIRTVGCAFLLAATCFADQDQTDLKVLFLGDNGLHKPKERFAQLEPVMRARGIELTYTDRVGDINPVHLKKFDALLLYANIERIEPAQEEALINYVASGGGFVPLHCASFCFQNSPRMIELIGAQFKSHGWKRMRKTVSKSPHPITSDYGGFDSWDETYVHHRHNEKNRTVLSYRIDGTEREPWTWVRTHGQGRVFYTAWGHDWHTWSHPGFHNLVERGIRWTAGQEPAQAGPYLAQAPFNTPKMTELPDAAPFEYVDVGAKIPNYIVSKKWGEQGKPFSEMQKPLPPAKSMERMVVPEGFHIELFAAEPQLAGKPICMTWDERGRLWIGETVDYPNELQPANRGRDRIRICEDTSGDGRADKFTVFAENLSIPTSIAFARGGVIVHNGTETLFLKDNDGDDRADERRVLLSGWAMNDTHGGPSNMQYGLDNWIWGMQGYNKSNVKAGQGSVRFAQGFHRFRPDGSEIEFLRSTNNNTWGLGISEEGIVFGSTANGNPSNYMPIPNRYYERVRGWTPQLTLSTIADSDRFHAITDKVRQVDHHGSYTAGAGHALYTARAYPRQYWNRAAFVCEPTGHLVGMFVVSPDGADFHSTSPANLLASDDAWTAPIMAEVGPDGCVWVIDWYNYIVQHNPTPEGFETGKGHAYETELRDKNHGRIYRIVDKNSTERSSIDLSDASPAELVETLTNDNLFWRRHAQRLLVERGKLDVVPQLIELTRNRSVDDVGLNVGAIHALWTLQGLGVLDRKHPEIAAAAIEALGHPSAGVRRNAVQVLPHRVESVAAVIASGVLQDADPQVRLQAALGVADLPPLDLAGEAIAQFLSRTENAEDRWLSEAATCAAARNAANFLIAAAAMEQAPPKFAEVCTIVANHFARSQPQQLTKHVLGALANAEPSLASAIVEGLAAGWPRSTTFPSDADSRKSVQQLMARLNLEDKLRLARLASHNNDALMGATLATLKKELFERVENGSLDLKVRANAAELIVGASPDDITVAERLLALATPQAPPELNIAILHALQKCETPELGPLLIDHMETLTAAASESAVDLLLSRPQLTSKLLDGIADGDVRASDLSLMQKQRLARYPEAEIRTRAQALLKQGNQNINDDRRKVLSELIDLASTKGDVAAGKEVFTKHCAICHRYQGEGTSIGPDLSGMSVHGKDQLLVYILDPNRDVEGNYQAYTVVTTEGRVMNGLLAGESATSIELIDAEGKRTPILREDIEELTRTGVSLMPEGFEKQLSRDQIGDVLEFLAQRSAFVPLDLRRVATVSSAHGMFETPGSATESLMFEDWGAKTFEGVPFYPVDPQNGRVTNVVMLHGELGTVAPKMPRSVELQCGMPAKAIHFLGGVSGWGFPATSDETVTMIVRLQYADGQSEDHELKNGVHFADYLGNAEVSGSKLAFSLGRQQLRYLKITPKRDLPIDRVELIKGPDRTAPVVMCITVERS